jgi:hypothetical protein
LAALKVPTCGKLNPIFVSIASKEVQARKPFRMSGV